MSEVITLHPQKHIRSSKGLGLPNTTKTVKTVSPTSIILEETWNEMEQPWSQEGIIIANPGYKWVSMWEEGKNHVIEKMFDNKGHLIGIYCDICSPVKKSSDGYEFEDWYLDVWQPANQKPQLLDEDELETAMRVGYLLEEQIDTARQTAIQLLTGLERDSLNF